VCLLRLIRPSPFLRPDRIPIRTDSGGQVREKTADICRKLGVSQATFYMWKKQYAGLGVQELNEPVVIAGREAHQFLIWDEHTGPDPANPDHPLDDEVVK
jgi:hypothetical protein